MSIIKLKFRDVATIAACLAVTVMFASCTKNNDASVNSENDKVDVYVAGYEASGQEYSAYYGTDYRKVAILWKNGVAQNLTDGTRDAMATSVFVSGDDVYVAGYEASGQEYVDNEKVGTEYRYVAKLWKNGVAQSLTDGTTGTHAYARSVFVSGSGVYVAGSEGDAAIFWKNGVADTLFTAFWGASANSVFVSGNDVYVAGYKDLFSSTHAGSIISFIKLFKNGIEQDITVGNSSGRANSIFVSGDDVYMAGNGNYGGDPILWKNNIAQSLSGGFGANTVFVSGNDVYVTGGRYADGYYPILWKNGTAQTLVGGTWASSVFVSGKDVYVAGSDDVKAILWKNGVANNLTDGKRNAGANSIFVVECE